MAKQKTINKRRQKAAKRFEAGKPSKYAEKKGIEKTPKTSQELDNDAELYIKDQ